jgi:LuxR family maltose regulon positive regulatory protein
VSALLDRGGALTVLRGASGAGKTVALRAWLESQTTRTVWITVTRDSSAPDDFAELALARLSGSSVEVAAPSGQTPWERLRTTLTEIGEPVVLVMDDAATAQERTLEELCRLIAAVPGLRVIAAENRRTELDRPGLGLLVHRTEIGPRELMFDDDEIARLLDVDRAAAADVRERTGGLPAIVHAVAQQGSDVRSQAAMPAAFDAVSDFFRLRLAELGEEPHYAGTLLRVSIAKAVDAPLAEELSGSEHAVEVLTEAEHVGFGQWTTGRDGNPLFRFAPFARALLRRELERQLPDEVPGLRRRVARWLLTRGLPMHALQVAVEADDLELANTVVMKAWFTLVRVHATAVRQVLSGVPITRLRQWPLLVTMLAVCLNAVGVRRLRGLQLFRTAIAAAHSQTRRVDAPERLLILTAESSALRVIGMRERAGDVAAQALAVMDAMNDDERGAQVDELPLVCAQLGISLHYAGRSREALECLAFGAALAENVNPANGLSCMAMLSGIHALDGDLPEARRYVDAIRRREWRAAELDGYQGTFYRVAEALIAIEEGDVPRARRHVDVFLPHRTTSEHWLAMAQVEALVALFEGRPAAGLEELQSLTAARGREGRSGAARAALLHPRVLLHLALGDTAAARAVLARDGDENSSTAMVERARVALAEDRPADALRVLSERREPVTSRLRAHVTALRLAALLQMGGGEEAQREAKSLAAVLCDRELRRVLAFLTPAQLGPVIAAVAPFMGCDVTVIESLLAAAKPLPRLTAREREALRALMRKTSLAEAARDLNVSPNTVKTQLKSVYRKLGVSQRNDAIAAAVAHRLLDDD